MNRKPKDKSLQSQVAQKDKLLQSQVAQFEKDRHGLLIAAIRVAVWQEVTTWGQNSDTSLCHPAKIVMLLASLPGMNFTVPFAAQKLEAE